MPSEIFPSADQCPTRPLTARSEVFVSNPERYARQLVAHLGRRVSFTTDGPVSSAGFGAGTGRIQVADGLLVLEAQAPDEVSLERVQDVLGRHLERFGQRHELIVNWVRP